MKALEVIAALILFSGCIVDGKDLPTRLRFNLSLGEVPSSQTDEQAIQAFQDLTSLALFVRVDVTTTQGLFYGEHTQDLSEGFNPAKGADFTVDVPSGENVSISATAFANGEGIVKTYISSEAKTINVTGETMDVTLEVSQLPVGSLIGIVIPPEGKSLAGARVAYVDCWTEVAFPHVKVMTADGQDYGMFKYDGIPIHSPEFEPGNYKRSGFFVLILANEEIVRRDFAIMLLEEGKSAVSRLDFTTPENAMTGCRAPAAGYGLDGGSGGDAGGSAEGGR